MKRKNKYIIRAHISEAKFRQFIRQFSLDITAGNIAYIVGLNRNTVNRYLYLVRERIAGYCEKVSPILADSAAAEETIPVKAAGPPLFGLLQRDGRIFTELLPTYATPAVRGMLKSKDADSWPAFSGYDCLVDMGCTKPYHARPGSGRHSLSGSFWSFAKRRLAKFHGVPRRTFYLHLKECEFRFNLRTESDPESCYRLLLKIIRDNPLN